MSIWKEIAGKSAQKTAVSASDSASNVDVLNSLVNHEIPSFFSDALKRFQTLSATQAGMKLESPHNAVALDVLQQGFQKLQQISGNTAHSQTPTEIKEPESPTYRI